MLRIRITEDKGAKRPSDQSEPKASGYGIVTVCLHISVSSTQRCTSSKSPCYLDAKHPNNRGQGRKAPKSLTWVISWLRHDIGSEAPGFSVISWRSHDITRNPTRKHYRPLNSTYGVIDYPMIKAILHSSISELWDRNDPLHISVSSTQRCTSSKVIGNREITS